MSNITTSEKRSIFPILWIMLFDHTALNVYIPVLTLAFFDLHSSIFSPSVSHVERSFWYGICLGLPRIGNLIFAPILSSLSDDFGRKKILLVGTLGAFIYALTAAFGILSGSLAILLFGQTIHGMFSRTNPVAQAAIGDISSNHQKARNMGLLLCAICTGAFIGPIIGGYFANRFFFSTFNFALPYFVAALFAIMSFNLALFIFRETLPAKMKISKLNKFDWNGIKKVLLNKQVLIISITLLTTQFTWSMYYQSISPILKKTFNFSPDQLGLFMGLIAIWLVLTAGVGIKYLEKALAFDRLFTLSLCLMLGGSLLSLFSCLFHLSHLVWIGAIPVAMGDLMSYVYLVTKYSNAVSSNEQGKVMGICFMVISLTWACTGILSGILLGLNVLLPLAIAPLSILVTFLISMQWTRGEDIRPVQVTVT